jgi:hypothetical protein
MTGHHDPVLVGQPTQPSRRGALVSTMEVHFMRYLFPIALALPLACASAAAQQIDDTAPAVGHGLICDSPQQVHRFVDIRNQGRDADEALRTVNEEANNPIACGTVMAAFAAGKPVDKMKMLGETVEVVEITIMAISDGTGWTRVPPTTQYMIRSEPGITI